MAAVMVVIVRYIYIYNYPGPLRGGMVSRGDAPGPMTNKQVESCFLNHNSSNHFCCTDSFPMTHRGGLRPSDIFTITNIIHMANSVSREINTLCIMFKIRVFFLYFYLCVRACILPICDYIISL